MIEDGAAYGVAIALQHVLSLLERKSLLSFEERKIALDAAFNELDGIKGFAPGEKVKAHKAIGALYLRQAV